MTINITNEAGDKNDPNIYMIITLINTNFITENSLARQYGDENTI